MVSKGNTIHFSGTFDAESREAFKKRRLEHGLSRNALAQLLGVDGITIKRWECGPVVNVTAMARNIIETFMSGGIDHRIKNKPRTGLRIRVPAPMRKCVEKLASVYGACGDYPDIQSDIVNAINGIVVEIEGKTYQTGVDKSNNI